MMLVFEISTKSTKRCCSVPPSDDEVLLMLAFRYIRGQMEELYQVVQSAS